MPLASGTRLASYEIIGPLGKGGMGEVYRARDTRLHREIALKILPDNLLGDHDRILRFEREAKVLAALNHAHIATIYGVVEHNTSLALAMELVDGPTLAERLDAAALPTEEALPIARQIAEALEYAHERGVVHRDLKPANIKLMSDGTVKVLDFGLAKVLDSRLATGMEAEQAAADVLSSPTVSAMGTRVGTILGTAAYMSPEQAKGKAVDRRADIWAFGCLLYEMLTGVRPFSGETTTDTLAAIVRAEPDWSRIPSTVPVRVRELLQRCLRKEARSRLQSIGDARVLLEETASQPEENAAGQEARGTVRTSRWWIVLPWALAGLLAAAAVAFFLARPQVRPSPSAMAATLLSGADLNDPAISPDGHAVVYVHENLLWLRKLDELEAHRLDGTEGAEDPFWSSDSQAIGYLSQSELRVVSAAGGVSRVLWQKQANQGFGGGTWSGDRIVLSVGQPSALYEIPASGGAVKEIAKADPAKGEVWVDRDGKVLQKFGSPEQDMRDPAVAPDGLHVAVTANSYGEVLVQDSRRNAAVKINAGAGDVFSPRWMRDGKKLAFLRRDKSSSSYLVLSDGNGTVHEIQLPTDTHWGDFSFIRDGQSMLIECTEGARWGICKLAVQEGAKPEKLVFRPGDAARPRLSPDEHFLAYQSDESGRWEVYVQPFPAGEGRWQVSTAGGMLPKWNSNGKELAYLEGSKLMVVPVETKLGFQAGVPRALLSGTAVRSRLQAYSGAHYDYSADGQKFVVVGQVTADSVDIIAMQNWHPGK